MYTSYYAGAPSFVKTIVPVAVGMVVDMKVAISVSSKLPRIEYRTMIPFGGIGKTMNGVGIAIHDLPSCTRTHRHTHGDHRLRLLLGYCTTFITWLCDAILLFPTSVGRSGWCRSCQRRRRVRIAKVDSRVPTFPYRT